MCLPLREHKGETVKERRRLGADLSLDKNEEEYEGEVTAMKEEANDTTLATIGVYSFSVFILNPRLDNLHNSTHSAFF